MLTHLWEYWVIYDPAEGKGLSTPHFTVGYLYQSVMKQYVICNKCIVSIQLYSQTKSLNNYPIIAYIFEQQNVYMISHNSEDTTEKQQTGSTLPN